MRAGGQAGMICFMKASSGNNVENLYGLKLNVADIFWNVPLVSRFNKKNCMYCGNEVCMQLASECDLMFVYSFRAEIAWLTYTQRKVEALSCCFMCPSRPRHKPRQ
jgi:hypothetical protein